MKKYYVGKTEITEAEAIEIERKNQEYMNSADMNDWLKCQFVVVINK